MDHLLGMSALLALLLDPVVVRAAGAAMGVILIGGALVKLQDGETFRYAVENYGLLGPAQAAVFGRLFPALELASGLFLLVPALRPLGLACGLLVLGIASGGVVINLLRGRDRLECGCGLGGQRISWGLVLRNAGLAALLVLGAQSGMARELSAIDVISMGAAALALLALYACLNQLLANQPLLKEIHS